MAVHGVDAVNKMATDTLMCPEQIYRTEHLIHKKYNEESIV